MFRVRSRKGVVRHTQQSSAQVNWELSASAVNSRYAPLANFVPRENSSAPYFTTKPGVTWIQSVIALPEILFVLQLQSSRLELATAIQARHKGMGFLYRIPRWSIQPSVRDKGTQPQSRRYNVSLCGFPLALK